MAPPSTAQTAGVARTGWAPVRPALALAVLALALSACAGSTDTAAEPAPADPTGPAADGTAPDDVGSAPATDGGGVADPLRVGLIPNVAPEEQRARYDPFGTYMEEALGVDVELFVATNYAGVVTALAAEQLDVAYLGGLTYVQAEQQVDLTPLVTEIDSETGTERYLSAIVVPADSSYTSTAELVEAGASVAFGDVSSTSGSLYPRIMLTDAGADCSAEQLDSCPPLGQMTFTGGHDATAQAVLNGAADAGGLELRILHRLARDGVVPGVRWPCCAASCRPS